MKYITVFLLILFIIPNIAFGFVGGCDDSYLSIDNNNHSEIPAIFTPNEHTCLTGEFLPANIDECRACPQNGTCTGGTYTFDESLSQGITLSDEHITQSLTNTCIKDLIGIDDNNHSEFIAIFTPNTHTCSAGYYLPANVDACTLCPVDNICAGGTYSFNETTDQGIVACTAPTPYAPTGSSQCFPHILHVDDGVVYLRSTKLTSPSLHIRIEDDVFYANMTTIPTRMNKDSPRYFHSQWDDNHYYICDDTTYPGE